jgi:hypothetical protein
VGASCLVVVVFGRGNVSEICSNLRALAMKPFSVVQKMLEIGCSGGYLVLLDVTLSGIYDMMGKL